MGGNRGFTAQTRDVVAAEDAEARAASEAAGVHPGGATLLADMGPGATAAVARATPLQQQWLRKQEKVILSMYQYIGCIPLYENII